MSLFDADDDVSRRSKKSKIRSVVGKWLILQFLKGLERPLALGLSTCSNSRNSPAAALDVSYLEPVWKTRQLEQDTEEKRSLR